MSLTVCLSGKSFQSTDNYIVQKLRLAAALYGVALQLEFLDAKDSALHLKIDGDNSPISSPSPVHSQQNSILRYIFSLSPQVTGPESSLDRAQIDQWLEVSWNDIEVPLQTLLSLPTQAQLSEEEKSSVRQKCQQDIESHLQSLDNHLGARTFLVGERASLADVALFATFQAVKSLSSKLSLPNVARWAGTLEHLPALSGTIASTHLDLPAGKWGRGRIRIKELLANGTEVIGKEVVLKGWIRTMRSAEKGAVLFVELTDGSTVKGVQLVFNMTSTAGAKEVSESGGAGASISIVGLVVSSPAKGQTIEVNVLNATVLGPVYGGDNGEVGGKNYPMAKKAHSLEFLREKAHLRPRSKVFSSAMRMRHAMAFATHKFFNERGQLNVETHACALTDVYTFGPTFRAENSHTARHLAEFWMIEPEICFAELVDDMALAEDYVRYCAKYALEHCADDLHYFEHEYPSGEKGLVARLTNVVESEFAQITYTEAVALLQKEIKDKKVKFEKYPNWGDDLGSEHERYITEQIYKKPTIVINYPKGIKAFYMKLNDDNETVAAMDILVPKIGELIGGSQREDNLVILERRCVESGMKPQDIWWYADLRRYGTGLENIRDVIPFPRVPGHADF